MDRLQDGLPTLHASLRLVRQIIRNNLKQLEYLWNFLDCLQFHRQEHDTNLTRRDNKKDQKHNLFWRQWTSLWAWALFQCRLSGDLKSEFNFEYGQALLVCRRHWRLTYLRLQEWRSLRMVCKRLHNYWIWLQNDLDRRCARSGDSCRSLPETDSSRPRLCWSIQAIPWGW